VVEDVRRSVLMKADDVGALREQTLREGGGVLAAAAADLLGRLETGGTLLALGNGGSATDAMDVVADFRSACPGGGRPRRALNLAEDPSILTAIANDVGPELMFVRQVIAYGRAGDALIALSTSGNSVNVLDALAEARRRGLLTIALVGYDGGRVAAEALADHVVVTRSQHIPRIQEAQASAYHVLRELVG
jgi:D-sedoheptulose 7-phosphate isomerase